MEISTQRFIYCEFKSLYSSPTTLETLGDWGQRSDKDKNIIQSLALENLKDAIMSHIEIIVHDRIVPTVEHEVN